MKKTWTDEQIQYLKDNYGKIPTREIANHLGRKYEYVKDKAGKLGLKTGNVIRWQEHEDKVLIENYANMSSQDIADMLGKKVESVYNRANILGLKKSKEYITNWHKTHISEGFLRNSKKKGSIPHNKGISMSKETYAKCAPTMFKKGTSPPNTNKEGDGAVVLHKNNKWRCYNVRISLGKWIPLHRYVWEQVNGEIPKGYIVTFKDRDFRNCTIENLELMTRADNMRRNSLRNYPKHIQDMIHIIAGFNRKLNKRIKDNEKKNKC